MRRAAGLVCLILCCGLRAPAQTFANSSLSGKYYFVQLLVTVSGSTGLPTTVTNLGGSITFNGGGSYTYSGSLGTNAAPATSVSGNGSYSVSSEGSVAFTNPVRPDLLINGRLSADQEVVLGSTTADTTDITGDVFAAVLATSGGMSNASLNGTYNGSTLALPNGAIETLSSSLFGLAANGAGQFVSGSVTGHEADQFGLNVTQALSGSSYSINPDGTGTANFGSSATLLNGSKSLFVSADGNYLLGFSTGAGQRDILLATKGVGFSAGNSSLSGRYWIAELDYDAFQDSVNSGSGCFLAGGNQSDLLSERLNGNFSLSSIYYDAVSANGLGQFVPSAETGLVNMALGGPAAAGSTPVPSAIAGAQIDEPGIQSTYYGVFFAVLAPTFSGSGGSVFLKPNGAVNAATFAPFPNALAPGDIVALFGSGLSPAVDSPNVLPLPASDLGVSVTVNGMAAPLFYISPGQINIQIPLQAAGSSSATIRVTNNGQQSNAISVPLAPGDPGIFMWPDSTETYHASAEHLDGTIISPANPAAQGETIVVFANGLGALSPAVATGAANPSVPPAASTDKLISVLFDGEPGSILFAGGAPTFVGENQINVVIPSDATTGSFVPMQIESSWGYSSVANLAIQ